LWSPVASVLVSNDIAKRGLAIALERWPNDRLDRHGAWRENSLIRRPRLDLPGTKHRHACGEDEHGRGDQRRPDPSIELRPPSEIDFSDAREDPGLEVVPVVLTNGRGVHRAQIARYLVVV